jgi:hypothetical protein
MNKRELNMADTDGLRACAKRCTARACADDLIFPAHMVNVNTESVAKTQTSR